MDKTVGYKFSLNANLYKFLKGTGNWDDFPDR